MPADPTFTLRSARTTDVPLIQQLVAPLVQERILLGKDSAVLYGALQEFVVAEDADGALIGCGALHVMWEDLGEVRTVAVDPAQRGGGIGHAIVEELERRALELGVRRLFCLTFEVGFFVAHGYHETPEQIVTADVYAELVRSGDEGVAEFLDLSRVKPNTLGNTRMLKEL